MLPLILPFSKLISTIHRRPPCNWPGRELMCCKRAFASVNQAENSLSTLSAFSLIICIKNSLMRSPDALLLIRAPRRRLKGRNGFCSLRHSGDMHVAYRSACLRSNSLSSPFAFIARALPSPKAQKTLPVRVQ
jgi:hypothetical protein